MQSYDLQPPRPPPAVREILLELFRARVDTVYKVVHIPTVFDLIRAASSDVKQTTNVLALEYAIYFMAICTINENEAEAGGLGSRIELLRSYRVAAEHFLISSELMEHPDLHALQALIIYMVSDYPIRISARC